jgi:hypothetical protein
VAATLGAALALALGAALALALGAALALDAALALAVALGALVAGGAALVTGAVTAGESVGCGGGLVLGWQATASARHATGRVFVIGAERTPASGLSSLSYGAGIEPRRFSAARGERRRC